MYVCVYTCVTHTCIHIYTHTYVRRVHMRDINSYMFLCKMGTFFCVDMSDMYICNIGFLTENYILRFPQLRHFRLLSHPVIYCVHICRTYITHICIHTYVHVSHVYTSYRCIHMYTYVYMCIHVYTYVYISHVYSVLQCVAVLQHTAAHCNTLQHTATRYLTYVHVFHVYI